MPNQHEKAVKSALNTVDELGELFDRLSVGNSAIHVAYRTVLRALKGNLNNVTAVNEAMDTLKASIKTISTEYYGEAVDLGVEQSITDLGLYGMAGQVVGVSDSIAVPALAATMQAIEVQAKHTVSFVKLDMDPSYTLGDGNRQGVVRPAPIIGEMKFWVAVLQKLAYKEGTSKVTGVRRQAVAQIDQHTTRTCLNVHGQMVGRNEKFHLTGTPKYADEMLNPPFHRGCRTGIALIPDQYIDGKVTEEMRKEAIAQGKKPKPSTLVGRAHYKVVGKTVQEFRGGRWHKYWFYGSNAEARSAAASLNEARRS